MTASNQTKSPALNTNIAALMRKLLAVDVCRLSTDALIHWNLAYRALKAARTSANINPTKTANFFSEARLHAAHCC